SAKPHRRRIQPSEIPPDQQLRHLRMMGVGHRHGAGLEAVPHRHLLDLVGAVVAHQEIALALAQHREELLVIDGPSRVQPARGECVGRIDIEGGVGIELVAADQFEAVTLDESQSVPDHVNLADTAYQRPRVPSRPQPMPVFARLEESGARRHYPSALDAIAQQGLEGEVAGGRRGFGKSPSDAIQRQAEGPDPRAQPFGILAENCPPHRSDAFVDFTEDDVLGEPLEGDGQAHDRAARKRFHEPHRRRRLRPQPTADYGDEPGLSAGIPKRTSLRHAGDIRGLVADVASRCDAQFWVSRSGDSQRSWMRKRMRVAALTSLREWQLFPSDSETDSTGAGPSRTAMELRHRAMSFGGIVRPEKSRRLSHNCSRVAYNTPYGRGASVGGPSAKRE